MLFIICLLSRLQQAYRHISLRQRKRNQTSVNVTSLDWRNEILMILEKKSGHCSSKRHKAEHKRQLNISLNKRTLIIKTQMDAQVH